MIRLRQTIAMALLAIAPWTAFAGIRSEGKYSGVVIFDRWDGCTLYSGVYVMYISESVKERLRKSAGECVTIDAKAVSQPMNPGDGLISKFEYLGHAKASVWTPSINGLTLKVSPAFVNGEQPRVTVIVRNDGYKEQTIDPSHLAPTLLTGEQGRNARYSVSDGPSVAIITRQSFRDWPDKIATSGRGTSEGGTYVWKIEEPFSVACPLQPKEQKEFTISFELAAGQYDFLAGYGGGVHDGPCLASNLLAFDVDSDGKATLVKLKSRQ